VPHQSYEAGIPVSLIPGPGYFSLEVNTSVNLVTRQPVISFQYLTGQTGNHFCAYDNVTFVGTWANKSYGPGGPGTDPALVVDGTQLNPSGYFDDAEFVMAAFNSNNLHAFSVPNASAISESLCWNNTHNLQPVPNAWDFGADTAETTTNATSASVSADGAGGFNSTFLNYTSTNVFTPSLAYSSAMLGLGGIGISEFNGNGSKEDIAVSGDGTTDDWAFTPPDAELTLLPGTYHLWDYSTSHPAYDLGYCTIASFHTLDIEAPDGGTCSQLAVTAPVPSIQAVDVGQKVTFSTVLTGSTGTHDAYTWTESSLGLGCSNSSTTFISTNDPWIACTPSQFGTYDIYVSVTGFNGLASNSPTSSFVVNSVPTPPGLPSGPTSVTLGSSPSYTTALSQKGTPPLRYVVQGFPPVPYGGGPVLACSTTTTGDVLDFTCYAWKTGTFLVNVSSTDETGYTVVGPSLTITVNSGGGGGGGGGCPLQDHYCGACVAYNTPILTPEGWVEVQNLTPGMEVVGYDPTTGYAASEQVESNVVMVTNSTVIINGGAIVLTATDQPIYVRNASFLGWLRDPQNLTASDDIFDVSTGTWVPITSVVNSQTPTEVYDLDTDGFQTFVANGYLLLDKPVHCFTTNNGQCQVGLPVTHCTTKICPRNGVYPFFAIIDPPYSVEEGVPAVFVAEVFNGTTNQSPPFAFSWSLGDGSPYINTTNTMGNTSGFLHTYEAPGIFTLFLNVTNVTGYSEYSVLNVTVIANPVLSSISASPSSIDQGQATILSITASGGNDSYYTYNWTGLPAGCSSQNAQAISCTPTEFGTFEISVFVTDANGFTITSPSLNFTVFSDPSIATPSPSVVSVDINQTVTFSTSATGGSGGYEYRWSCDNKKCFSNNPTATWTPKNAGERYIYVNVTDSNGFTVQSGILAFMVYNLPKVSAPTVSISWGTRDIFTDYFVNFSATNTGHGSGGDTYQWINLPPGYWVTGLCNYQVDRHCISTPRLWSECDSQNSLALSCLTHGTGRYSVQLEVTDSNGGYSYSDPIDFCLGICVLTPPGNLLVSMTSSSFPTAIGANLTFYAPSQVVSVNGIFAPRDELPYYTYVWSFGDGSPLVTMVNNGSFAYVNHTYLTAGNFTVTLTITDPNGSVVSYQTIITVIVPLVISAISATRTSLDQGQSTLLEVAASGGIGAYTVVWSGLPPECSSMDSTALTCTPFTPGTYAVLVTVTDSAGSVAAYGNFTLAVYPAESVSLIIATPGSGSIDAAQATTLSLGVSGGFGNYTYVWNGLPSGCISANVSTFSCTILAAGTYHITVTVTDGNGFTVTSAVLTYVVDADPIATTPTASQSSADLNQSVTFRTSVGGGSGGYTYAWNGLPTGCASSNTTSLVCTPTKTGTFHVSASVTDSNGFTNTSLVLTYMVNSDPIVAEPTPSTESFGLGQAFTLSTMASGGSGAYAYGWIISNSGLGCTLTNSSTIQCTPTAVGSYTASVRATDTNGYSVTSGSLSLMVIDWNYGNLCSVSKGNCQFTGSGHCDPALAYSFNGTRKTLNVVITGSSDCVYLNVSGSHVVVNVQVTGSSMPYLQIIMAGSNDFLNLAVTGSSDSTFVYVFGQSDVYNLTVTGSSLVAKTYFLGFDPGNDSAPAGNLSRTDSYNLKITGSSDTQSIVYVNSVGYSSSVHKVSAPKNIATGSSDFIVYQNMTGVWGGPWDTTSGLPSFIPSTPTGAIPAGDPV